MRACRPGVEHAQASVRAYLHIGSTTTARELAKKAVVAIDPGPSFGRVVWPPS